jgi:hypothetical protein
MPLSLKLKLKLSQWEQHVSRMLLYRYPPSSFLNLHVRELVMLISKVEGCIVALEQVIIA